LRARFSLVPLRFSRQSIREAHDRCTGSLSPCHARSAVGMLQRSSRASGLPMKLHGYWRSSASYRIRIILNLKEISWEYASVALNRGEHREAGFRALNPAALVPLLECEGRRLAQSTAIAEFLEERHPTPALLPADPFDRARVRELQGVIGCDVHPLQNLRVLETLRRELGQDDAGVEAWCRRWIAEGFAAFEARAAEWSADGRFSVGSGFTLAD